MLSNIFLYFTLFFIAISSLPAFSASVCEVEGFSPKLHQQQKAIGVESYRQLLIRLAQSNLGVKELSPQQIEALETYHHVVRGEKGEDGSFARVDNYTFSQRRRIVRFLREVFSPEQVTTLIEAGVVEINRSSDLRITRRVLRHFNEGKKIFIQLRGIILRINKILVETNNGFLVEAEWVDREGSIIQIRQFLITGNVDVRPLNVINPFDMIKISEKNSYGFVIDIWTKEPKFFNSYTKKAGNKVFFSFEKAIEQGLLPANPTAKDYREIEDMINAYVSHSLRVTSDFNTALARSLIEGIHDFRLASPESEAIFLAVESNRKKIDSSELNIPSPINEEAKLAEQGYGSVYIGGLNQVNERVIVRRLLQELQANPRITHIEYFADQIPVHIAHIRQGLENNYFPNQVSHGNKLDQLRRLESLEVEAKKVIEDEGVTYEWWLKFNLRLANVMYGLDIDLNLNSYSSTKIDRPTVGLSFFPIMMVMPSIQTKEGLGIITFNRADFGGEPPAGLIDRPTITGDNEHILSASEFFLHDIQAHSMIRGNQLYWEYSAGHRLFHKRLLTNIENLPPDRRKKAEAVYFLMTRESTEENISYGDWALQQMKEKIVSRIRNDITGIFRMPDDPVQKKQKIEDFADTFMAVYVQTLQHQ